MVALGLDFVNLPSLLILSVSQLPDRERCLRESCRRPRETEPLPICMQMVESSLARRAASSYRIAWSCLRRRLHISKVGLKKWPPRKAATMTAIKFNYQRKIVILWMYAVIEPLPELAPSNWKLMSRSPCAQPRLSAE